jgi:hypothetical protein
MPVCMAATGLRRLSRAHNGLEPREIDKNAHKGGQAKIFLPNLGQLGAYTHTGGKPLSHVAVAIHPFGRKSHEQATQFGDDNCARSWTFSLTLSVPSCAINS